MAFLDINSFSLHYEAFQGIHKNNVLFIHGNLASNEWWHPTIELWRSENKSQDGTVVCADWRGYGKSKGLKSQTEINFKQFASDYITLLEELNLTDVHIVGHSTGGLIAMLAILERPDLFKSLVLLDSVGPTGLELTLPKEQVLAHFEQMSINKDYCFQVLAATIEGMSPQSPQFLRLAEITWNCDKVMWKGVIDVLSSNINFQDRMKEINLPTLILHGEKDLVLPLKGSENMHQLLPNSQLKVIANHGHSLNMEDPKLFKLEVDSFWESL